MASSNKKCDVDIRQRLRHTRSRSLIWCLPAELLVHLFKGLEIKDLLNLRSVNIEQHCCVCEQTGSMGIWR